MFHVGLCFSDRVSETLTELYLSVYCMCLCVCISACLCMLLCLCMCTCICVCVLDISSFLSFIVRKNVFGNTELDFIFLIPSEFSTSYVLNQCLLLSRKETVFRICEVTVSFLTEKSPQHLLYHANLCWKVRLEFLIIGNSVRSHSFFFDSPTPLWRALLTVNWFSQQQLTFMLPSILLF